MENMLNVVHREYKDQLWLCMSMLVERISDDVRNEEEDFLLTTLQTKQGGCILVTEFSLIPERRIKKEQVSGWLSIGDLVGHAPILYDTNIDEVLHEMTEAAKEER